MIEMVDSYKNYNGELDFNIVFTPLCIVPLEYTTHNGTEVFMKNYKRIFISAMIFLFLSVNLKNHDRNG